MGDGIRSSVRFNQKTGDQRDCGNVRFVCQKTSRGSWCGSSAVLVIGETLKQLSLKVSQYFLDFLETDFKRQQAPRRRVILQTPSGFKAGIPLSPYRTLLDAVWNVLRTEEHASELQSLRHLVCRLLL